MSVTTVNSPRSATTAPAPGKRVVVGSYPSYDQAQHAMDFLADQDFPVAKTAIVGQDLRTVETILGKLTWPRAAGAGALTGAWIGLLVSLLLGMFTPDTASALRLAIGGLAWGAVFGAVFALAAYATTRGRRDFVSQQRLVAGRYDILADPDVAEDAKNHLTNHSWRTT